MKASSLIPGWIRQYHKPDFRFDLIAGLTVGVMLIPQAMAYAMLAGIPPIYGLYASTFPAIVYGVLGSCRQLSVGPTAMVAMLTASGAAMLAQKDPASYVVVVAVITCVVGLIQFILGVARLGFLVKFLSHPVMIGFTSAAAIIIGLSQLKYLLGTQWPSSQYIQQILYSLYQNIGNVHWLTLAFGTGSLLVLIALQRLWPKFPGALVAVFLAISVTWLFQLNQHGLSIIGAIPGGIPHIAITKFDFSTFTAIVPTALAIALISFMESTAVSHVLWSRHHDYRVRHNRELISIGLSNLFSGLLQALPVSGGMSRSMVNDQAGARTGLASIISAMLILFTLALFTPLFYYLPHAVLAAIIMIAVYKLVRIRDAANLWKLDRKDFWMMLATFLGTLTLGITSGIGIGVLLSLAWIIFEASYPHHAELGRVPNTSHFRNVRRFSNLEIEEGILIFRFDAPMFFANAYTFQNVLLDYKAQRKDKIQTVIIDMESVSSIDSSSLSALEQIITEFKLEGVDIILTEVKGPVRDKLHRSGLTKKLGDHHFFISNQDALQYLAGGQTDLNPDVVLQTNSPRKRSKKLDPET